MNDQKLFLVIFKLFSLCLFYIGMSVKVLDFSTEQWEEIKLYHLAEKSLFRVGF